MKRLMTGAALLVAIACHSQGRSGTPPEFPFPVTLPTSVTTIGTVTHADVGKHAFPVQGRDEVVTGETWSGHVRVVGYSPRDPGFLATLELALITNTGWVAVFRNEKRDPPVATLRRTLGEEILWISLEGWPDDVTVTMVHRK